MLFGCDRLCETENYEAYEIWLAFLSLVSCALLVRVVSCEFVVPTTGKKTGTTNSHEITLISSTFSNIQLHEDRRKYARPRNSKTKDTYRQSFALIFIIAVKSYKIK